MYRKLIFLNNIELKKESAVIFLIYDLELYCNIFITKF